MFCEKAATKTSCCYELMKFLLLIKSRRISSSMKTTLQKSKMMLLCCFCLPLEMLAFMMFLISSFDRYVSSKGFLEPSNALDAGVLVDTKT